MIEQPNPVHIAAMWRAIAERLANWPEPEPGARRMPGTPTGLCAEITRCYYTSDLNCTWANRDAMEQAVALFAPDLFAAYYWPALDECSGATWREARNCRVLAALLLAEMAENPPEEDAT